MKHSQTDCEKAMAVVRRQSNGESVNPDELNRNKEHIESCKNCLAMSALVRAVASEEKETSLDHIDDLAQHRAIDCILDEAVTYNALSKSAPSRFSKATRWGVGAALAAASVAVFLIWTVSSSPKTIPVTSNNATQTPGTSQKTLSVQRASTPIRVSSQTEAPNNPISANEEPTIIALPTDIEMLIQPGGQVSVTRTDETVLEVTLNEGDLTVRASPTRRGPPFRVVTPNGTAEVKGTIFIVNVGPQSTTVHVLRGKVAVNTPNFQKAIVANEGASLDQGVIYSLTKEALNNATKRLSTLDAPISDRRVFVDFTHIPLTPSIETDHKNGAQDIPSKKSKIKNKLLAPTVHQLLQNAIEAQRNKQWKASLRFFQRLIQRYPNSAAATHSNVSMGNLLLDNLHEPKSALAYYQKYLSSRDNTLREEALFGKARALKRIGRSDEERRTLLELLSRFPNTVYSSKAQNRLTQLHKNRRQEKMAK